MGLFLPDCSLQLLDASASTVEDAVLQAVVEASCEFPGFVLEETVVISYGKEWVQLRSLYMLVYGGAWYTKIKVHQVMSSTVVWWIIGFYIESLILELPF